MVLYGLLQLKGQLHIINNTQPITEILSDNTTPDSVKQKLLLINEIKQFAVASLGLKNTDNYTSYYDQQGKPVLWVLTVAPPFKVENYQWDYPFLGKLSYKGFFEKERGIKEKQEFEQKGFDADLSPTGGWSTLGWFKDPVLSNMLKRSEGSLAELIIHELTHATLYIKGNVEFNENLATFIGEKGAEQFLAFKYNNDSTALIKYLHRRHDEKVLGEYILQSMDTLKNLYNSFNASQLSIKEMYNLKFEKIAGIMQGVSDLPLYNKKRYEWDFTTKTLPDNTYFLSYSNYRKSQTEMESVFKDSAASDLKQFIEYYKSRYGK
jgi:predicted aminopeptidase